MLIFAIELLPEGFESLRRPVASMSISDEAVLADVSDYRVTARESANPLTGHSSRFRRRVGLGTRPPAACLVAASEGLRRGRQGGTDSPARRGDDGQI
jgi:hypothetical protein